MNLSTPVTIQPPNITRYDGEIIVLPAFTLGEIDFMLADIAKHKVCFAQIRPFPQRLMLWEGAAYDDAGDYTQAQVEARILELLGPDIKAGLEALYYQAPQPVAPAPPATTPVAPEPPTDIPTAPENNGV